MSGHGKLLRTLNCLRYEENRAVFCCSRAGGGGSVLRIQCRVLSVEFSKMDDAGLGGGRLWGSEPPPNIDSSVAVIVQFCRSDCSLCVLYDVLFSKSDRDCSVANSGEGSE